MSETTWDWTTCDGLKIFSRIRMPDPVRGLIILIHGLGEHTGRYAHLAEVFNGKGFAMAGFDLRGHGQSEGPRGHTPSLEAMMRDIDDFIAEVKNRFQQSAQIPLFIYGHSLGGILVLNYLLRRKTGIKAAVVTGPSLRTALQEQKFKVFIARIIGRLMPSLAIPSGLVADDISSDSSVVMKYKNDPLVHNRLSLGMGLELMNAVDYVFDHAHELPIPLLLMQGSADRIVYPSGSAEFKAKAGDKVTLKIWEGMYHEIHNEPDKKEVFRFTINWLDSHL